MAAELNVTAELDVCSKWIVDHNHTDIRGDRDLELEWLAVCIGPQR